ncbi:MAG: hypothetical protein AAGK37_05710 [Pseudomonadota bacterium]
MRTVVALLLSAILLQGCATVRGWFGGSGGNNVDGLPYRARIQTGDDKRDFTVTVRAQGASLDAVRESARFPATRHCLRRVGLSDIDWQLDPSGTEWAAVRTADGDLVVRGRCSGRA